MGQPVFIELTTDAFAENLNRAELRPPKGGVRRPVRGFEIKEDTYAIIKVIRADGTMIPLTDSAGPISPSVATTGPTPKKAATYDYANFIIQRIDESRQEKSQVLETFGDTFVFFFGERPRILSVAGILMNTADFNWRSEFWYNYENILRGTKLVEQNARLYLFYDDIVVEGYMLRASAQDIADMPYQIPFSFQLLVTNHQYLGTVGQEDYPITHAINIGPLSSSAKALESAYLLSSQKIAAQRADILTRTLTALTTATFGGKNSFLEAVNLGVQSAALAFMLNVKNYFKNRIIPIRTLPVRSKLRDNQDEFVANYDWGAAYDDVAKQDISAQQFVDSGDAELAIVNDLLALGASVYNIVEGGIELLSGSHTFSVAQASEPVFKTAAIKVRGYE